MLPSDLSALADLTPDARHVVFAKDQPEYIPLPALVFEDGKIMTEWSLTETERLRLIAGERVLPQELRTATIHRLELPQGRFERHIQLPPGRYETPRSGVANGLLVIRLAKVPRQRAVT